MAEFSIHQTRMNQAGSANIRRESTVIPGPPVDRVTVWLTDLNMTDEPTTSTISIEIEVSPDGVTGWRSLTQATWHGQNGAPGRPGSDPNREYNIGAQVKGFAGWTARISVQNNVNLRYGIWAELFDENNTPLDPANL